jgi:hypothetical protein
MVNARIRAGITKMLRRTYFDCSVALTVSSFLALNIKLSFIKKGQFKKGVRLHGIFNSPGGFHIGSFRHFLLKEHSRRLGVRLIG